MAVFSDDQPMIDHMGLSYSDYEKAKELFTKVMAALGAELVMELTPEQYPGPWTCGFGRNGKPDFWISQGNKVTPPMHLAFVARTRAEVRAFYEAAIAAGATDNGKPGIREVYHPNYYGAFVRDFDGHNIEAVCHKPE